VNELKLKGTIEAFEKFKSEAEGVLREKKLDIENLAETGRLLANDNATATANRQEDFDAIREKMVQDFKEITDSHADRMDGIRRAFAEELALRAPAQYWLNKQTRHLAIAAIAGILAFFSFWYAASTLPQALNGIFAGASNEKIVTESVRLITGTSLVVFTIWAIRIIVRVFMSQLHLSTDASERVVMVKTYLSLIEGKASLAEEDRKIILNALFRTTSDRIIKDDGLPNPVMDFATKTGRPG
jgi:hypothetical protein